MSLLQGFSEMLRAAAAEFSLAALTGGVETENSDALFARSTHELNYSGRFQQLGPPVQPLQRAPPLGIATVMLDHLVARGGLCAVSHDALSRSEGVWVCSPCFHCLRASYLAEYRPAFDNQTVMSCPVCRTDNMWTLVPPLRGLTAGARSRSASPPRASRRGAAQQEEGIAMHPLPEVLRRRLDNIARAGMPAASSALIGDTTADTSASPAARRLEAGPVGSSDDGDSEVSNAQARPGLSSNATDSDAPAPIAAVGRHVEASQTPLPVVTRGQEGADSGAAAAPNVAALPLAHPRAPEVALQQPGQRNNDRRLMRRSQVPSHPSIQLGQSTGAVTAVTGKRLRGAFGAMSSALTARSAEIVADMGCSSAESATGASASSSAMAEFAANAKEALRWIQRTEQGNDRYAALLSGNREFERLQGGTTSGCFMFKVTYPRFGKRTVVGGDWRAAGDNHEDTVKMFPVAVVQSVSQEMLGRGSVSASELAEVCSGVAPLQPLILCLGIGYHLRRSNTAAKQHGVLEHHLARRPARREYC